MTELLALTTLLKVESCWLPYLTLGDRHGYLMMYLGFLCVLGRKMKTESKKKTIYDGCRAL
jgi:hypothetical protein